MTNTNTKKKLDAKTSRISSGMNHTTRSQLKKIQKVDTSKYIEQVPMGELYVRLKGIWVEKGKYCYICGSLLGFDEEVLDKHRYVCAGQKNIGSLDD
jgi:hypothetical protein